MDTQFGFGLSFPTPGTFFSTGGSPPFQADALTPVNNNEPYLDVRCVSHPFYSADVLRGCPISGSSLWRRCPTARYRRPFRRATVTMSRRVRTKPFSYCSCDAVRDRRIVICVSDFMPQTGADRASAVRCAASSFLVPLDYATRVCQEFATLGKSRFHGSCVGSACSRPPVHRQPWRVYHLLVG